MTDPTDIRGWQRLDPHTTTSGIIAAGDIARLQAIGVAQVINLALADHPEILPEEGLRLAEAGIGYTHIPVPWPAPEEAHFAAFRAALDAVDGPVHVHCVMNWRVSAFFYRLNRDHRGMPEAEAEARALMAANWEPETSTNADAPAWAAFIAPR
jgi:uncharacterized protein (TIGR01244 family)